MGGAVALHQPGDRAPADGERRDGDDDDLDQRGERLGLAVAEAVIVVGRARGDADSEQGDQRGEQIEAGVGERAQHRHRAGLERGKGLEREQEERGADARQRRPRGQRGAVMMMVMMAAAHG